MKKLYWRPQRVSRAALLIISLVSVAGIAATEAFLAKNRQPYYREKIAAARLAARAMDVIKTERILRDLPVDSESDPAASGLIGELMSPVTSHTGYLQAKQTSVNPNFAAVIVHELKKAGVNEGDVVAVGLTGSFPALNIAVCAALETLKVKPIAVASVAASQWGANFPALMHFLVVDPGASVKTVVWACPRRGASSWMTASSVMASASSSSNRMTTASSSA